MEPLEAVSVNGNGDRIAVAARSGVRIYSVDEERLRLECEHRYPRGKRYTFLSSGSVSWSPVGDEFIASTSLNGAVVIWHPEAGLMERNYRAHSVAATKVCFSRQDKNVLVSGAKDGSVASYDLRQRHPVAYYRSGCEQAIRDIQFSNDDTFVTADDNGFVRFWDLRKPDECLHDFNVHFGSVNSISLQNGNVLATGGKDKFLRVWHINDEEPGLHLKYWIETMASVSKVMWDPYHEFHLLSCYSSTEGSVHIWDVRRAYLPYATFDAHRDVCTDIAWLSDIDRFVSTGKDGRVVLHATHEGELPAQHVSVISLDSSPHGTLLTSVKQHIRTRLSSRKFAANNDHPMGKVEPSLLWIARPVAIAADMTPSAFIWLAKEYAAAGEPFQDLCARNSQIAAKYGQCQASYAWRILGTLFDPVVADVEKSAGSEEVSPAEKRRGSKNAQDKSPPNPDPLPPAEEEFVVVDEKTGTTIETFFPNGIPDSLTAGTDMYFGPEELNLQGMSSEPFPSVHALFGNGRAEAIIPEDFFEPRQELPEWSCSESFSEESQSSFPLKPPSDRSSQCDEASEVGGVNEDEILKIAVPVKAPAFDPIPMIVDCIYHFADEGDLQMCAMICLVMGEKVNLVVKDRSHAVEWIKEYVEMLERFELWNVSSMIVKSCRLSEVNVLGNESTFYKMSCLNCSAPSASLSPYCPRCKKKFNIMCVICETPCMGVWTACNRCGHGGHHEHLQDWFKECTCRMLCAFRSVAARTVRCRRLLTAGTAALGVALACGANVYRNSNCHASGTVSSLLVHNPWLISTKAVQRELQSNDDVKRGFLASCVYSVLWNVRLFIRFLHLSVRIIPLLVTFPPSLLHDSLQELWWRWLIHTIRKGGPSLLKLCQWASTRRDIFSKQFCDKLAVFHTKTKREVSSRGCELALTDLFGEKWRDFVISIAPTSIGSGCIAQVYKARISMDAFRESTGIRVSGLEDKKEVDVAIKVADEAVLHTIDMDLAIFKFVARLAARLVPSLAYVNPVQCLEQFEVVLKRQTNLANEARALQRFGETFDRSKGKIFFPIVLHASENVLVESFEEGIYVNRLVTGDHDIAAHQVDSVRRRVAVMGARALLKMIFVDNFIHSDLHPGNILVRFNDEGVNGNALHKSPTSEDLISRTWSFVRDAVGYRSTPRIGFTENTDFADDPTLVVLDTGLVIEETPENLRNLRDVFAAILTNNGYEAGRLMLTQSPNEQCENPEQFCREVGEIVNRARSGTSLRQLHVSQLLSDLFTTVSTHRVALEPSFTSVVLSVMILEGFGRSLFPELDLFLCARPYVLSVLRQR